MAEYIERKRAIVDACNSLELYPSEYATLEDALNKIPAADVAPVVHGYWISFLDGDEIMPERFYKCSRCGRVERRKEPYCHCGARMDGCDGNIAMA